jgi:hypothetical protein
MSFSNFSFSGSKIFDDTNKIWFSFFDGSNYDNIINPPVVTSSNPYDGAYDVPIRDSASSTGLTLEAYFDQPLQDSSVTTTSVKLKDSN